MMGVGLCTCSAGLPTPLVEIIPDRCYRSGGYGRQATVASPTDPGSQVTGGTIPVCQCLRCLHQRSA